MIQPTQDPVVSQAMKAVQLTGLKAGVLALMTTHLYTNNYTPTPLSGVGDFTEATFTGYTSPAVGAWGANELNPDGSVRTENLAVQEWVGPGDATGQTVYGVYYRSAGAGTPYLYAERFTAPVALTVPGNVLDHVADFVMP